MARPSTHLQPWRGAAHRDCSVSRPPTNEQRIDALIKRSGTPTPCSAPRGRPDHRHAAAHRAARSRRCTTASSSPLPDPTRSRAPRQARRAPASAAPSSRAVLPRGNQSTGSRSSLALYPDPDPQQVTRYGDRRSLRRTTSTLPPRGDLEPIVGQRRAVTWDLAHGTMLVSNAAVELTSAAAPLRARS